jgi:hypothetical protein
LNYVDAALTHPPEKQRSSYIGSSVLYWGVFAFAVFVLVRSGAQLSFVPQLAVGVVVLMLPLIWLHSYRMYTRLLELRRDTSDRSNAFEEACGLAIRGASRQLFVVAYVLLMMFLALGVTVKHMGIVH